MKTTNDQRFRLGIAAALIGFGLTKLLAQLFLGNWQVLSAGQSDIAARGIWLLAAFLPAITLGAVVVTVVLVVTLTRRLDHSLAARLIPALAGGVVGAVVIFFGFDPIAGALGLISWSSAFVYHVVSATAACVIFGVGVAMVVRFVRVLRVTPAAA